MLRCTGKTLEAKERKNAVLFIAFLSYSLSQRLEPMGPLSSAGP